jgi:hypothetical protein
MHVLSSACVSRRLLKSLRTEGRNREGKLYILHPELLIAALYHDILGIIAVLYVGLRGIFVRRNTDLNLSRFTVCNKRKRFIAVSIIATAKLWYSETDKLRMTGVICECLVMLAFNFLIVAVG